MKWYTQGKLQQRFRPAEEAAWLTRLGIQTVLGAVPQVHRITPLEIIGREVIPAVADL
jgi:hypothetical protein